VAATCSNASAIEPAREIQAAILQLADKAGRYLMAMPLRISLYLQDCDEQVCSLRPQLDEEFHYDSA
jgi:hypothetical protein